MVGKGDGEEKRPTVSQQDNLGEGEGEGGGGLEKKKYEEKGGEDGRKRREKRGFFHKRHSSSDYALYSMGSKELDGVWGRGTKSLQGSSRQSFTIEFSPNDPYREASLNRGWEKASASNIPSERVKKRRGSYRRRTKKRGEVKRRAWASSIEIRGGETAASWLGVGNPRENFYHFQKHTNQKLQ